MKTSSPIGVARTSLRPATLNSDGGSQTWDATGTIEDIRQEGDSYWVTVKFPPLLAPYLVRKGSIAVNGISLTVAGVDDRHFDVQIIPFTWDNTNLHSLKTGEQVNIECDILGKYVVRVAELAGITSKTRSTH